MTHGEFETELSLRCRVSYRVEDGVLTVSRVMAQIPPPFEGASDYLDILSKNERRSLATLALEYFHKQQHRNETHE